MRDTPARSCCARGEKTGDRVLLHTDGLIEARHHAVREDFFNVVEHMPIADMHLPQSMASVPGMSAVATKMLKKQIADLGVPEIPDFLDQIVAAGG